MNDLWNMKIALEEAEKAYHQDEVPVGAVVVDGDGVILSQTHNLKEQNKNACDHAEVLAITEASKKLGDWRLNHCTLYVTLEPCVMCMGAIVQSRVGRVVFGAYDKKGGAVTLGFGMHQSSKLNHKVQMLGGVMHFECSKLLSNFFKSKRKFYKSQESR